MKRATCANLHGNPATGKQEHRVRRSVPRAAGSHAFQFLSQLCLLTQTRPHPPNAALTPQPGPSMHKSLSARVPQLDGLRAIAVGLVILFHYGVPFEGNPLLGPIISNGWVGVDLFFVMSGFLIGGIVIANREAANFYSVFYLRRFLRIFPLYYLLLSVVAIAVALGWMPPSHAPFLLYAVYLQNIVTAFTHDYGLPWLQVTWSLAIEEHFYLLLPILVGLLRPKLLFHVLLFGIFAAIISRILGYVIPVSYPRDFARFFTLCRVDDLFYGVLLAVAVRSERAATIIQGHRPAFYLGAVLFGLGFLVASHFDSRVHNEILICTIGLSLLGPLFSCVVILAVMHESSLISRMMKGQILGWIGKRAYAIYLFHIPVIESVKATFRHFGFHHSGGLLVMPALILTLGLATASWLLIEAPLINLGHKHKYGRGAKALVLEANEVAEPASP
jgi:peptidoglycan/LPS O-acetylase OafA/YrhL